MATTPAVSKEHIEITPGTCGGRPRIARTRITVDLIAQLCLTNGQTPRQIVEAYPHLELADIHAALAYYLDHKREIDRRRIDDDAFVEQLVREGGFDEKLKTGPADGSTDTPAP
jgi:uncharacterized protein (DUF433 family)